MTLVAAVIAEQLHLDLVNECLVQWFHRIAQNHIDSKEVISCFDDIIDLDCFAAGDNAVGFIQHFDLVASQSVAGHTPIAVVETNEPKMCLNSAVLSVFSNFFH